MTFYEANRLQISNLGAHVNSKGWNMPMLAPRVTCNCRLCKLSKM